MKIWYSFRQWMKKWRHFVYKYPNLQQKHLRIFNSGSPSSQNRTLFVSLEEEKTHKLKFSQTTFIYHIRQWCGHYFWWGTLFLHYCSKRRCEFLARSLKSLPTNEIRQKKSNQEWKRIIATWGIIIIAITAGIGTRFPFCFALLFLSIFLTQYYCWLFIFGLGEGDG